MSRALPASRRPAFTLLELIVVIVVLGVLASIAAVSYQKVQSRSADKAAEMSLQSVFREAQALAALRSEPMSADDLVAAIADLPAATAPGVAAADAPRVLVGAEAVTPADGAYAVAVVDQKAAVAFDRSDGRCSFAAGTLGEVPATWSAAGDTCRAQDGLDGPSHSDTPDDEDPELSAPTAPDVDVTATSSEMTLSWDLVAAATSYLVERDGTEVATVEATSFASTEVGLHRWAVRAANEAGTSAPSAAVLAGVAPAGSDGDGILERLGVLAGAGTFKNPQTAGLVRAWSSYSDGAVRQSDNSAATFTNTAGYGGHSYFYDFGPGSELRLTHYGIQATASSGIYPRTWTVFGSTDGTNWVQLDARSNDGTLNTPSEWGRWPVVSPSPYRFVQLHNNGPSSNGRWDFQVGELELYGSLVTAAPKASPDASHTLSFEAGGDDNGLFAYLGGLPGTYTDPTTTGALRAMGTYDSANPQFDRNPATMTNTAGYGMNSYIYDLGAEVKFRPRSYTLQAAAAPAAYPRAWNLAGSSDGLSWVTLDDRSNDATLTAPGQIASWPVAGSDAYRYLRLLNDGPSSNGRWDFQVAELELYGEIVTNPRSPAAAASERLAFDSYGSTSGLFAQLGGAEGTFVNPTTDGTVVGSGTFEPPYNMTDRNPATLTNTVGYGGHSYTWDLGPNRKLALHRYAIQAPSLTGALPRTWELQGSLNGVDWVTLWDHNNDTTLRSPSQWASWDMVATPGYRMFRILNDGLESYGHWSFRIGEIELYGDLTTTPAPAADPGATMLSFGAYNSGGLFSQLGPSSCAAAITCTQSRSSAAAMTDANGATYASTDGYGGSTFTYDLKSRRLRPTFYTLQTPTGSHPLPRGWTLAASNDGATWTTLSARTNDMTFNRSGQWGGWHLDTTTAYRYFRLENTQPATSGKWDNRFAELGLYGHLTG